MEKLKKGDCAMTLRVKATDALHLSVLKVAVMDIQSPALKLATLMAPRLMRCPLTEKAAAPLTNASLHIMKTAAMAMQRAKAAVASVPLKEHGTMRCKLMLGLLARYLADALPASTWKLDCATVKRWGNNI